MGKSFCIQCLMAAFVFMSGSEIALAASTSENSNEQAPSHVTMQASDSTTVLGQDNSKMQNSVSKEELEAQALFEESLNLMMPLTDEQIQEYREYSDKRERALLPVSPSLNSRTVRVSLEPGLSPVKVFTTANIATSLVFHDVTGQPWAITSVTNGGSNFFQILRPELPEGNLLNVMPMQDYGASTIVVTFAEKDVPLVIRLESDSVRSPERKADALVLFQLAHQGPNAHVPVVAGIKETVTSDMLAFLDRVPPKEAVRIRPKSPQEKLLIWQYNDKNYIRTSSTLVWPAWSAVVNGAGDVKCYETPVTSRIMLSVDGIMQSIALQDTSHINSYEDTNNE